MHDFINKGLILGLDLLAMRIWADYLLFLFLHLLHGDVNSKYLIGLCVF